MVDQGVLDIAFFAEASHLYLLNSVSTSVCRAMSRCSATSLRIALSVPTRSGLTRDRDVVLASLGGGEAHVAAGLVRHFS
jgi:hypothetical protein